jgi:hypothetical protein
MIMLMTRTDSRREEVRCCSVCEGAPAMREGRKVGEGASGKGAQAQSVSRAYGLSLRSGVAADRGGQGEGRRGEGRGMRGTKA